ncbi:MAG TPA: hypothetical protein VF507_01735 [Pyrinomonadaceae bacterium]|jgi:hypothetical protein
MKPSKTSLLVACLLAFALAVNAFPQAQQTPARASARASKKPAPQRPPCRTGDFIVRIDPNATGSFNIPICIAQHSPVVIEFPASDPFYAHHPGDEKFVTIDKRSKTNDPLVIRPGDGFFVEPGRVRPSSVISVQMTSGLVGSFPIYAVEDVSLNNSHVIVSYNRAEVVAARRALGLRADLVPADVLAALVNPASVQPAQEVQTSTPAPTPQPGPRFLPRTSAAPQSEQPQPVPAPTVSLATPAPAPSPAPAPPVSLPRVAAQQSFAPASINTTSTLPPANVEARPAPSVPAQPKVEAAVNPSVTSSTVGKPPVVSPAPSNSDAKQPAPDLEAVTRDEMARVSNGKQPLRFGSAVHGLSLAVSRSRFVVAGYRVEVIAVRNALSEPVRLVPGQPEVYVETVSGGRPVSAPRLTPRFTVSTLPDGAPLAPGVTYYFAFAFDEPILGVNDFLRVALSQTNAADEPASANLITAAR